ncbi:hypothetical protein CDEST_07591 [Colletotrichum destructivum]|uniref:Uncharacterized protein n=1 Tax=Colletotrichum destructivum TaxID=34406 RepID=A0AAX4IH12_9PEZI|nr:hypothetical protein CDEST_07591 [Colletotrichum destructivum]
MHLFSPYIATALTAALLVVADQGDDCSAHKAIAGEYVTGAVPMNDDPLAHFDTPMVTTFNSSASEVWAFDAGSHDGKAGIVVYLSRGTVASNLAAQRALISVSWPNGSRYMENAFYQQSVVTSCAHETIGTWSDGADGDQASSVWRFTASRDLRRAKVSINSPTIQGTFELENRGPPLYPGGLIYPNPNASVLLAPEMYWQEHFPVASASANLSIKGTPFVLSGVGGRDKNWNSRPWAVISGNWDMARAVAGPYGLMLWNYTSGVDGRPYFSATLMKEGNVVFRTVVDGGGSSPGAGHGTSGTVSLTYGGPHHLTSPSGTPPMSRHTGYVVDLVSQQRHWRFNIDFSQTVFWFPADKALTVGQYVGNVTGGLVGGRSYNGVTSGSLQEFVS